MSQWKIAWFTEGSDGVLRLHDDPAYFDDHDGAKKLMKTIVREIEGNPRLHSKRQVVKMYYGRVMTDSYESRPLKNARKY